MKKNLILGVILLGVMLMSVVGVSAGLWITGDVGSRTVETKQVTPGDFGKLNQDIPSESPLRRTPRESRSMGVLRGCSRSKEKEIRIQKQDIVKKDLKNFREIEGLLREHDESRDEEDKLPLSFWEDVRSFIADMDRRANNM